MSAETQRLKQDEEPGSEPEFSVDDSPYHRNATIWQRIRDVLQKPDNLVSVTVVAILVVIGIVSAIAFAQRSQSHRVARFVVISDYGTGSDIQDSVAEHLAKTVHEKNVRFVLALGNNFYPTGVNSTEDSAFRDKWFDIYYDKYKMKVRWYSVLGDLDYKGNVTVQRVYTSPDVNDINVWNTPNQNYAIKMEIEDSSPVYVLMLDTVPLAHPNGAETVTPEQMDQLKDHNGYETLEWVRSMLSAHSGQQVLVAGHHPVRLHVDNELGTLSSGYSPNEPARGMRPLDELMREHSVTAYFSGHVPINDFLSYSGLSYFISGTGGCPNTVPSPCSMDGALVHRSETEFASRQAGFMLVELDQGWMDVSFINAHGSTVYKSSLKIKKTKSVSADL